MHPGNFSSTSTQYNDVAAISGATQSILPADFTHFELSPGTSYDFWVTASSPSAATNPPAGPASATTQSPPKVASGSLSNPVTTALVGSHATYDIGPGQGYAEPDLVP